MCLFTLKADLKITHRSLPLRLQNSSSCGSEPMQQAEGNQQTAGARPPEHCWWSERVYYNNAKLKEKQLQLFMKRSQLFRARFLCPGFFWKLSGTGEGVDTHKHPRIKSSAPPAPRFCCPKGESISTFCKAFCASSSRPQLRQGVSLMDCGAAEA